MPSTGTPDNKANSYSILKAKQMLPVYKKYVNGFLKNGATAFGDYGINNLTADYTKDYFGKNNSQTMTDRQQSMNYQLETMAYVRTQVDQYLVNNFYGYMLPFATNISNLPIKSSRILGMDEDIPFVQMVLSRFAEYSATPVNLQVNSANVMLKMLEYGAMPSIYMIGTDAQELQNTSASDIYTGYYMDWISFTGSMTERFKSAYEPLANQYLIAHKKLKDGVYKASYSKGTNLYINYNSKVILTEGVEVPPMSYKVK